MKRCLPFGVSLLALAGCLPVGGQGEISCTTSIAPHITSSPPRVATAGFPYYYYVDASYACFPFVCSEIVGTRLPGGATASGQAVSWTPSDAAIGRTFSFRIATRGDSCGRSVSQSWSVRVYAAPAIGSFSVDPQVVSTGGTAQLAATFAGTGSIDHGIGAVTSGVAASTGPLDATTTFTLSVANEIGATATQQATVQVLRPPVIQSFTANRTLVTQGDTVMLEWSLTGDSSSAILDPDGADVSTATRHYVTPTQTTTYELRVSNAAGASDSATAHVQVLPPPLIQSFTATPDTTTLHGSVQLTAAYSGGQAYLNRETADGYEIIANPAPGESIDSGNLMRSTRFVLLVINDAGSSVSANILVTLTGPETFAVTASAPVEPLRAEHVAVRLADGRVLIAGGQVGALARNTSELFDPATGGFTAGPLMNEGRIQPGATLLQDGRVLIVGGRRSNGTRILNAEVYDPAANRFDATGNVTYADLVLPRAVALDDGRALIVHPSLSQGAETFYPIAGAFAAAGPLQASHGCIDLVRLADGRALVIDGSTTSWSELFDPQANAFTLTSRRVRSRCSFASTVLGDGRVLIAGGSGDPAAAELFDPLTETFADTAVPGYFTTQAAAVTLANGGALLVQAPYAEVYDPVGETFTATGGLRDLRRFHSTTVLGDGRVLVVGGCSALPCAAEVYSP